MADKTDVQINGKVGVLGWLLIILFVLKLNPGPKDNKWVDSPVKDWSWWLVTAPLWGPLAVVAVGAVVFGLVYLVARALDKRDLRKRRKQQQERLARQRSNRSGTR